MKLTLRDGKGNLHLVDKRYFGQMKKHLDDLERRVLSIYLFKVANEILFDIPRRIARQVKPDGSRQKRNSVMWKQYKESKKVRPNIPLHHEGVIKNPFNYKTNIVNNSLVIRVPPNREAAYANLKRLGYGYFQIPENINQLIKNAEDKMTPHDWFAMLDIFSVR